MGGLPVDRRQRKGSHPIAVPSRLPDRDRVLRGGSGRDHVEGRRRRAGSTGGRYGDGGVLAGRGYLLGRGGRQTCRRLDFDLGLPPGFGRGRDQAAAAGRRRGRGRGGDGEAARRRGSPAAARAAPRLGRGFGRALGEGAAAAPAPRHGGPPAARGGPGAAPRRLRREPRVRVGTAFLELLRVALELGAGREAT